MLDLFKTEIQTQSKKSLTQISQLATNESLIEHYEALINTTRAIKGAAKLVHVDIIEPTIEQLESTLSTLQNTNTATDKTTINTLNSTITLFIEISNLSLEELENPETKFKTRITSCINQLITLTNTIKPTNKGDSNTDSVTKPPINQSFTTADKIDPEMFNLFCIELQI